MMNSRTRAPSRSLLLSVEASPCHSRFVFSQFALNQYMDTSNPAAFVNGELLRFYVGRRVRAVIQIIRSDSGSVIGKSTDEKQLVVKGLPPPTPLTNFVEVIGVADSDKSIHAEIWTNFGDTIDTFSYNKLCQLANGEFKHLFL
ncbi:hypothetical protein L6164_033860 [Bauhinia variegata]|uniref:Uncharacterized protein n=1 Tax=Bauhinia variegata TaxID=167791 RepID=A0ACB9KT04_BAUVA|nr:hypothetical protein L6164_033860 [Bauhinia variegata]